MVKNDRVLGIIFPNMHDEFIRELTELRTTASVPFGGRYRLIDFTLSEMVAAGVEDVAMVVKRNYVSLMDHLGSGKEFDLARKRGGLKIFPPFAEAWTESYKGKIQALNNVLKYIEDSTADTVILSDAGLVSSIDYSDVLSRHWESGAQITALYKKEQIDESLVDDNVVFEIDADGNITDVFINEGMGKTVNNGLWAYVIDKKLLVDFVKDSIKKGEIDFERDILQRKMEGIVFKGYEYKGYLKRISSLKSYFDANLDLTNRESMQRLFSGHPVYTKIRDDAPTRYTQGSQVNNVVTADGCFIEGYVYNSVLFRGVRIGKGAVITNCVLMQDTVVEDGATLENVICDKNVVIRRDKRLVGDPSFPVFVPKDSEI